LSRAARERGSDSEWRLMQSVSPVTQAARVIVREPSDRRNNADSIGRRRIASVEIMLCELPHEAISPYGERKRVHDGCLAAAIGADDHRLLVESNPKLFNTSKAVNLQMDDMHEGNSQSAYGLRIVDASAGVPERPRAL
jgi:hypothetical protein